MTIRHLESFRDWAIHLNTDDVNELIYALGVAIQVNSEYDDCISKLHVDTCKHMQDVLRNREQMICRYQIDFTTIKKILFEFIITIKVSPYHCRGISGMEGNNYEKCTYYNLGR